MAAAGAEPKGGQCKEDLQAASKSRQALGRKRERKTPCSNRGSRQRRLLGESASQAAELAVGLHGHELAARGSPPAGHWTDCRCAAKYNLNTYSRASPPGMLSKSCRTVLYGVRLLRSFDHGGPPSPCVAELSSLLVAHGFDFPAGCGGTWCYMTRSRSLCGTQSYTKRHTRRARPVNIAPMTDPNPRPNSEL